jgi:hypothetical protein
MPNTSSPIRVSIPANVAGDLGSFKKAVGSILDKLGCQACCSGNDILFEIARDFHVDRSLQVHPSSAMLAMSASGLGRPAAFTYSLDREVGNKIDSVFKAIEKIAEMSGHSSCCSGFDVRLNAIREFVVNKDFSASPRI